MKHLVSEGMICQWPTADDAMPQLTFQVDSEGMLKRANRALPHWDQVAAKRHLNLHDAIHQNCRDPSCYLEKFWRTTKDALVNHGSAGGSFWDPVLQRHFEIRSFLPTPVTVDTAKGCFAVVVIDDVTEFRLTELRTREANQSLDRRITREVQSLKQGEKSNSRLYSMLDMTPICAAMSDRNGRLTYVNPSGRAMLGLAEQEDLSALSLIQLLAPGARTEFSELSLPYALSDGAWSGESVLIGEGRQDIDVHLTLISHRDESGKPEGYTLLGRDISESMRIEAALRITQDKVSRLAAQHLSIQESERRRIATDLHDGLGQTLSLIKLSIDDAARTASSENSGQITSTIERLGLAVKTALSELRRTAMNLRPSTLDHLGIKATLAWHFREFEAASTGIRLERDISIEEADVPDFLKITIYRIVQEAMGNALKHARADTISVSLHSVEGAFELSIEDDGQGFELAEVHKECDFTHGLGLQSMLERAQLSGGDYELASVPGEGTKIHVRWATTPVYSGEIAHKGWMQSVE